MTTFRAAQVTSPRGQLALIDRGNAKPPYAPPSGAQQRDLAQALNPQAKSPWNISTAITSAGAAS
jgi:hypothetical protein